MATNYIGQAVKRREDLRFITGAGQYTDDVVLPGQTFAYFIRSPHAHAKIRSIRKDKASKSPGVIAIFTGDDTKTINGLPCGWLITDVNNQPMKEPPHPVLAQGKVRHVGDQVAVVIAETLRQAKDAAELVEIDYDVLPAVVDVADARKPGAPARCRRCGARNGRWGARRFGAQQLGAQLGRGRLRLAHRHLPRELLGAVADPGHREPADDRS